MNYAFDEIVSAFEKLRLCPKIDFFVDVLPGFDILRAEFIVSTPNSTGESHETDLLGVLAGDRIDVNRVAWRSGIRASFTRNPTQLLQQRSTH